MYIIETKTDDLVQGRAQLFLQLHAAHIMNEQKGLSIKSLYGAVTSAKVWEFYQYYDGAWSKTQEFVIEEAFGQSFEDVASVFYALLCKMFLASVQVLYDSWLAKATAAKTRDFNITSCKAFGAKPFNCKSGVQYISAVPSAQLMAEKLNAILTPLTMHTTNITNANDDVQAKQAWKAMKQFMKTIAFL